jgi:hypothetical protein
MLRTGLVIVGRCRHGYGLLQLRAIRGAAVRGKLLGREPRMGRNAQMHLVRHEGGTTWRIFAVRMRSKVALWHKRRCDNEGGRFSLTMTAKGGGTW